MVFVSLTEEHFWISLAWSMPARLWQFSILEIFIQCNLFFRSIQYIFIQSLFFYSIFRFSFNLFFLFNHLFSFNLPGYEYFLRTWCFITTKMVAWLVAWGWWKHDGLLNKGRVLEFFHFVWNTFHRCLHTVACFVQIQPHSV